MVNRFSSLPPPHRLANYHHNDNDRPHHYQSYGNKHMSRERSQTPLTSSMDKYYNAKTFDSWDQNSELMFDTNVSWSDVQWLQTTVCRPSNMPLVIKGILTPQDAHLAIEAGADGIMVSNHGGRALDGALSTIDVLPAIVKAVDGRVPVLIDGGIRRGTDVLKALALGATAVGIGKPVFFALACNKKGEGGEDGVLKMLEMLKREIENAMAICGCQNIKKDVTADLVTCAPFMKSWL